MTALLIFHGTTLEPYMRIETDVQSFTRLAFNLDGSELWTLSDATMLDRWGS